MRTLAFFSQKGGSGKSTLAIHIAVVAGFANKVLLVDADPQGTVATWGARRAKDDPLVVQSDPSKIGALLSEARDTNFTLAILDCPPHAVAGTSTLLATADHIVIPCQPTMPDLAATQAAVALAQYSGNRFSFVLNRAPARAIEIAQAQEALATAGTLSPIVIGDRRAFSRALTDSLAVTEFAREDEKAAIEVLRYWRWLDLHTKETDTWRHQRAA